MEKQGCKGRSAGLQVPPEGSATALCKYMAAVHSRESSSFEARNLVILGAKTAGITSPPILFLPFEVTAHWVLSGLV